jgi:hypothetical protein
VGACFSILLLFYSLPESISLQLIDVKTH